MRMQQGPFCRFLTGSQLRENLPLAPRFWPCGLLESSNRTLRRRFTSDGPAIRRKSQHELRLFVENAL